MPSIFAKPWEVSVEMNYCRRCGSALTTNDGQVYICKKGHTIFLNTAVAVGLLLLNDKQELLLVERGEEPRIGTLNVPGGFCDGGETLEAALTREVREELGLEPHQYTAPRPALSHPNVYGYQGEGLPVLDVFFTAEVKPGVSVHIRATDELAGMRFVPVPAVDLDGLAFPSTRAAVAWLQQQLS